MSRSIRSTLTLWYISILAVILSLFSGALYVTVASGLTRDIDSALALQADGTAEAIFAFWRAQRAAAGFGPGNWHDAPASTFGDSVDLGQFPGVVARWAELTGHLQTDRPIRLTDTVGREIGASASFTQLNLPVEEPLIAKARLGHAVYRTIRVSERRLRLITRPVKDPGGFVLYLVQVASDLEPVDASLRRLRFWLPVLFCSTLAVTAVVGLFLATNALGPVARIVTRAQQFIAEHLHERLEVPSTSDEMERLVVTFDEMFERLERAFQRLRQFSAATSHELRTQLTVIKGEIGVTLRRPRSLSEYQRVLRSAIDAINEMTSTVEELLMIAKNEATHESLEWHPVDLGALAGQTSEAFRAVADEKPVTLEISIPEPVWVHGERRLLERLLSNLLDNAIKHTPAHGRVSVLVERQPQGARLVVQDSGLGIPPEQLPELFNQFFHRRSAANGTRSTGLGLGLCRWIAELHHGHIETSSAPGHGATFTVLLPPTARPSGS